jgi:hypothetical protein
MVEGKFYTQLSSTVQAIYNKKLGEACLKIEPSSVSIYLIGNAGATDSDTVEVTNNCEQPVYLKYRIKEVTKRSYVIVTAEDIQLNEGETKNIQITILVESGVYEENLPIKVPQNTSIVGDEFRRCIVRPRPGVSSSPWAFQKFRRDLVIDGLTTAVGNEFGYHYLTDSSQPVYPKINNKGAYTSAARLLELNRSFIQDEIIAWMDYNINRGAAPWTSFTYATALCKSELSSVRWAETKKQSRSMCIFIARIVSSKKIRGKIYGIRK